MPRRPHAPQNLPAQHAGNEPTDLVAGDPPVPITVWRTPAGVGQASISPRLADRLIAAYSQRGEVVIDLTEDHALAGAAALGGRRHHPGWFTDASALVIGPPTPHTTPVPQQPDTARTDRRRRRAEPEPAAIAAWFGDDLTDQFSSADTARTVAAGVRGATSLLVACWPLHPTRGRHRARLRWLLHAGVALLRPGGCLVLVVRGKPGVMVPASPQDYRPLVDAAADAGLGYLQHIVAVHADIDPDEGDQFTYYATEAELAALTAGEVAVAHLSVHADMLVFTPRQTAAGSSRGGGVRG